MEKYIEEIIGKYKGCEGVEVLLEPTVGINEYKNELTFFVKPEIFMLEDKKKVQESLQMIFEKLEEYEVKVSGLILVGGPILEIKSVIDLHYGFINRLSKKASQMLTDEEKKRVCDLLNLDLNDYEIFGGHEYLSKHPELSAVELDKMWLEMKSVKVRSGFYTRLFDNLGEKVILVNGFHPAQLEHFTGKQQRMLLAVLHSNLMWKDLKWKLVGNTFPDQAENGSIRGTLYAKASNYGFDSVSIANNCVHLSAGPFEAVFELNNFLGKLLSFDFMNNPCSVTKRTLEAGLRTVDIEKILKNPKLSRLNPEVDLFTATEDMDSDEAITLLKKSW